jgi:hypothetical protein
MSEGNRMSPAIPAATVATVHRIVIHPLDRYGSYCGFRFKPAGYSDMKPAGIPI